MKIFNILLANAIRNGEVTVNTPDLDMKELERMLHSHVMEAMRTISGVVFCEELSDGEKVATLQDMLDQWERA